MGKRHRRAVSNPFRILGCCIFLTISLGCIFLTMSFGPGQSPVEHQGGKASGSFYNFIFKTTYSGAFLMMFKFSLEQKAFSVRQCLMSDYHFDLWDEII